MLDVYNFCTPELKKSLDQGREYEKKKQIEKQKEDETKFENYKKKLEASGGMIPEDSRELFKRFKAEQTEEELKAHEEQLYRKHGLGIDTGNYELIAVLTHKGRTADSGHYVAWVHNRGGKTKTTVTGVICDNRLFSVSRSMDRVQRRRGFIREDGRCAELERRRRLAHRILFDLP